MLRDKKLAVFIDVDNTELSYENYRNIITQLNAMGEIVCATVYGATERKQKGVIDDAKQRGFTVQLPARTRKRVRKVFDDRIWVDVTDLVARNSNIDTVAIVAIPTDMVYLFSHLRRLGLQCVGVDNLDEASLALLSDVVKMPSHSGDDSVPKKRRAKRTKDNSAETLVADSHAAEETSSDSDIAETKSSVNTAETKDAAAAVSFENDSSSELIDKIEELYKADSDGGDDELVAEIQKILSGLD